MLSFSEQVKTYLKNLNILNRDIFFYINLFLVSLLSVYQFKSKNIILLWKTSYE